MRKMCECCGLKTVDIHGVDGKVLHVCMSETCDSYLVYIVEENE